MFGKLKEWVIQQVIWVENNLKGLSGKEKRAAVIARIDELIALPWYLEWADDFVIGYLVDLTVAKLNEITNRSFAEATPEQINNAIENTKAPEVEEQLEKLCKQYGVEFYPVADALSRNLTRAEIACKCGCGFNTVSKELVETFQTIRDYVGKPVTINSGCRCPKRNKEVRGAARSAHLLGQALDMKVKGMSQAVFGEVVKKLHSEKKLPYLTYCYLIANSKESIHIGVDDKPRYRTFGW